MKRELRGKLGAERPKYDTCINVQFTHDQAKLVRQLADDNGMSYSNLCRELILGVMRNAT